MHVRSPFDKYERTRWADKALIWFAWHLPQRIAYWAFIRVAVDRETGNPGARTVGEASQSWCVTHEVIG